MSYIQRRRSAWITLGGLALLSFLTVWADEPRSEWVLPESELTADQRILHALNRLGFGPRPGDLERVREIGLETWIDQQLSPEKIDDRAAQARLAPYSVLTADPLNLFVQLPPPPLQRMIAKRLTSDAGMDLDAITRVFPEAEKFVAREKAQKSGDLVATMEKERAAQRALTRSERMRKQLLSANRIPIELTEAKFFRAAYSERQLQEVMTDFWFNHFNVYIGKGASRWWVANYEERAIRPHALGKFRDLLGATAEHPAMLFYLDNWMSAREGGPNYGPALADETAAAMISYELPPGGLATQVLRDRGLDTEAITDRIEERKAKRAAKKKLREQRRRSKKSAATKNSMMSMAPKSTRGLNENYARELLELHTLGVDGGYTQQDIIEVARCFTGWTILPIQVGQGFVFDPDLHDTRPKRLLGVSIEPDGVNEGNRVLDLLAQHPSTARFISTKIARRFIADDPPQEVVEAMTQTFLESEGDIRRVLQTLFAHEVFWSEEYYRAKIKSPFEFVVSMLRASEAAVNIHPGILATSKEIGGFPPKHERIQAAKDPRFTGADRPPALDRIVRELGQPLYRAQPPTGYKDRAETWISTGTLLQRMKVAMALVSNRLAGVQVDVPENPFAPAQGSRGWVDTLVQRTTGEAASERIFNGIQGQLELTADDLAELGIQANRAPGRAGQYRLAMGWLFATPEFQRR